MNWIAVILIGTEREQVLAGPTEDLALCEQIVDQRVEQGALAVVRKATADDMEAARYG